MPPATWFGATDAAEGVHAARPPGAGKRSTDCRSPAMLAAMGSGVLGFVGRKGELDELAQATAQARAGHGGLWLIGGEAGSGKSRLAEEAARAAAASGMETLWGRCSEAGGAPAFWPWTQVLRAALRLPRAPKLDAFQARLLRQLLPGLSVDSDEAPPSLSPEQARFHLLDAATTLLADTAREHPLVVILDDLHVADGSSLSLLAHVARQAQSEPLLIVGTYRESGLDEAPQLRRALQEAHSLILPRLDEHAVGALLEGTLPKPPAPDLISRAHALSEGNALFLVELTRVLLTQGELPTGSVPHTLRSIIRRHLTQVPVGVRSVLELAAVVGREVSLADISQTFEVGSEEVARAFDAAERSGLVTPRDAGSYRFSHILIREVLHADIPQARREQLHAALGHALLTRSPRSWPAIAHHLAAAGPQACPEAAAAAENAASEALGAFAFEEAARYFGQAIELHANAADVDAKELAMLRLGRARALLSLGERGEGRELCLQAAEIGSALGDAQLVASAALTLGSVLVFAHVDQELVELIQRALAALGSEPSALRARLLGRLAAAQQPAPNPAGPIAIAHEAIALARQLGDEATLVETLRSASSAMVDLEHPARRRPLDEEHQRLALARNDFVDVLRASRRLVVDCFELGDLEAAGQSIEVARRAAAELDHPRYRWPVAALDAARALWRGQLSEAAEHIAEIERLGCTSGDPNHASSLAYHKLRLHRLRGEDDALADSLDDFDRAFADSPIVSSMRLISRSQLPILGRADEAARELTSTVADRALMLGDRTTYEAFAELALAAGNRPLAEEVLRRLDKHDAKFLSSGVLGCTWDAPVERARGLALQALGRDEEALTSFREGIASCRSAGGLPMVAWLAVEALETLQRLQRPLDAKLQLEATQLASRLGLRGLEKRLKRLDTPAQPAAAPAPPRLDDVSLRPQGKLWVLEHGSRQLHLKDAKGFHFLARLIGSPGVEMHALDLAQPLGGVDLGDAGEVLDDQARNSYRERLRSLEEELEEAENNQDIGRADHLRGELDALRSQLSQALGLGGRQRRSGSAAERARVNVQRRLRDALRRIEEHDAELAKQLGRALRTGTYCCFEP